MNYAALASLRNDLILVLLGIGIFAASLTAGLLTMVHFPPAAAPTELPGHMTPIEPQVAKMRPAFAILVHIGAWVFVAGIAVSIAGIVRRRK